MNRKPRMLVMFLPTQLTTSGTQRMAPMTTNRPFFMALGFLGMLALAGSVRAESPGVIGQLTVEPSQLVMTHHRRGHSVVVTARTPLGRTVDLTAEATFRSSNPGVVQVEVKLPATVPRHSFRDDVMPVLSKTGCNQGACHGYSLGKNGFKLSLRGADPKADFDSLTDEFLGRRINRHNPSASLFLTKPLGEVAHKGGVRLEADSLEHRLLFGWVREGAKADSPGAATFESLSIYPRRVVIGPAWQQQLQVIATYSDGSRRDVTRHILHAFWFRNALLCGNCLIFNAHLF